MNRSPWSRCFRNSLQPSFALPVPVLIVALLPAFAPSPAAALDLEPYLFAGVRDADATFRTGIACVAVVGQDCPTSASTEDGDEDLWGLGAAVRVTGPWWVDLRWSRQDTEARFFDPAGREIATPGAPFRISQLHAGALYRFFDGRRWSPFLTAFGGVARVESGASTTEQSEIDLDRASGGLGGGLLVDLGRRLGARLEVRGTRTDLPGELDGDLEQVEVSAGLRIRI